MNEFDILDFRAVFGRRLMFINYVRGYCSPAVIGYRRTLPMHTLSDAIRARSVAEMSPERQPGTYKAPYRGWVWLATFAFGTCFWVALGYTVYAIVAG
jgi:hypothetical protein